MDLLGLRNLTIIKNCIKIIRAKAKKEQKELINLAVNSTLGRTINTSMTTFIVLLAMFIVGGEAIKGFIFAIMIGVVVGTYSSICIATPSVLDFSKKKDETKSL